MGNDAIDRAIKRAPATATAGRTSRSPTRVTRPGGSPLLIDVLTDNRNRAGAEVRSVFSPAWAGRWRSLAPLGVAVLPTQGRRCSSTALGRRRTTLMLAALDAGAEDIADEGDTWRITSDSVRPWKSLRGVAR